MNNINSHFKFTKGQRSGIFLLLFLIIVLECVYFFVDFSSENIPISNEELKKFQNEIDSLKSLETENIKEALYPFNPNYITDHKGYTLGMSNEEIDRLLAFRKQNKWVNSAEEFQNVTKISDSLLNEISPYFKFPDWVTNPKQNSSPSFQDFSKEKTFDQKQDLNIATAQQLQKINGIGEVLSERIVKYRNKFQEGFIDDIQLTDIYGLTPEVIQRITSHFTVKTPRVINKLNINTATIDELVTVQYIDYEIAHNIIEERILREGFDSLDELTKVKDFPINKIEIIKLYLTL